MKNIRRIFVSLLSIVVVVTAFGFTAAAHAASKRATQTPPDLTKGFVPTKSQIKWHQWNLGPTGADGWMWAHSLDYDGTVGTLQIYVSKVESGSPSDGILQVGDVILGAGGNGLFKQDCRHELSAAITEAEKQKDGGKLVLDIWRKGKTLKVTIPLKVMGTYSADAPITGPKTAKIINDACAYLMKHGISVYSGHDDGGIPAAVDGLGMLASGRKEFQPMLRKYAHHLALATMNPSMASWIWGFRYLFLTEYYLATHDKSVLPAIRKYATTFAAGQSDVGTWGHGMAQPWPIYGGVKMVCGGYGAENEADMADVIALILAQKCGVHDPVVQKAIDRAANFYRYYVNKGSIPYGDHKPYLKVPDNNGKNSAEAIIFNLLGDKKSATYFTRMTLSSWPCREGGHTGNFWSMLWGALGAEVAGDQAEAAFMGKMRWLHELERGWQGNFIHEPELASSDVKYRGWDQTGLRLLQLCAPLHKIYITGRGGSVVTPITGKSLNDVVEALRPDFLKNKTPDQLVKLLSSWSPIVRRRAATALGESGANRVNELIGMLDSPNPYTRYGAAQGLRHAGLESPKAVDALVAKGVKSQDPVMFFFSTYALVDKDFKHGLYQQAIRAVPALLKLAAQHDPKTDPLRQRQRVIGKVLFYYGHVEPYRGIFGYRRHITNVDPKLLVPALKQILLAANGRVLTQAGHIFNQLSPDEVKQLWPWIYVATAYRAPSGVMFADGVRYDGLRLMAAHHVREGLELGLKLMSENRWGAWSRVTTVPKIMAEYGGAAKPYVPAMRKIIDGQTKVWQSYVALAKDSKKRKQLLALLDKIEQAPTPKLVSIKPYLKHLPPPPMK